MKQKITVRLESDDLKKLREIAQAAGVSRSEFLRRMIAGSRLRDIRVHRGHERELLYVWNKIIIELRRIAERADHKKELDILILQYLHQIRESVARIYREANWRAL
jgi:AraC-like DNA-binding protein